MLLSFECVCALHLKKWSPSVDSSSETKSAIFNTVEAFHVTVNCRSGASSLMDCCKQDKCLLCVLQKSMAIVFSSPMAKLTHGRGSLSKLQWTWYSWGSTVILVSMEVYMLVIRSVSEWMVTVEQRIKFYSRINHPWMYVVFLHSVITHPIFWVWHECSFHHHISLVDNKSNVQDQTISSCS